MTRYHVLSLVMHVTLLMLFSVYFDRAANQKKFGVTQAKTVAAFIYQGNFSKSVSVQEKMKSNHEKKSIPIKKKHREKNVTKAAANQNSVSQGEHAQTLVALLHDAIARKQQYPATALEMQRQGRVTVAFYLYQNGNVANVRMITSSGTASLDKAALQAVHDAAPFHELLSYIKHAEEYQIDIAFELA